MKKVLYAILVFAELLLGLAALSVLWNNTSYIAVAVIAAIWAVLLVWVLLKLKKADDAAIKRKLYRRLALVMASPVMIFIVLVIVFIIRLSMVI